MEYAMHPQSGSRCIVRSGAASAGPAVTTVELAVSGPHCGDRSQLELLGALEYGQ
jgi:hypothetical protein